MCPKWLLLHYVIKISVESVAESMLSKHNIHNSKIRPVDDITVEHEMMIDYNRPDIGEADGVLIEALHMHFRESSLGINFNTQKIFGVMPSSTILKYLTRFITKNIYNTLSTFKIFKFRVTLD